MSDNQYISPAVEYIEISLEGTILASSPSIDDLIEEEWF